LKQIASAAALIALAGTAQAQVVQGMDCTVGWEAALAAERAAGHGVFVPPVAMRGALFMNISKDFGNPEDFESIAVLQVEAGTSYIGLKKDGCVVVLARQGQVLYDGN